MQKNKISLFILLGIALSLILLIIVGDVYRIVGQPLIAAQDKPVIITLEPAASASDFAVMLQKKRIIQSTRLLLFIVRFEGWSNKLKAGTYQIQPGEALLHFLHKVVIGDVLTFNLTIIAGTTQSKIAEDLCKADYLHYSPEDWLAIKANYTNVEGLLLADTYQYQGGASSKILLRQAHQHLMQYLNQAWTTRDPNLPYKNAYELLTAASIIEKESALQSERQLISGILVNRLKKNMPLQMDPTVVYALGASYKGKLSHQDMQIDSPYNSYRYRGLPPTPIAMVGKEAIDAAAHPQWSNYLYFVAKGDGTHQFSESYDQQRRAIGQFKHKD